MKAGRRPARGWDAKQFADALVWTARVTRSSVTDLLSLPLPMYRQIAAAAVRANAAEHEANKGL